MMMTMMVLALLRASEPVIALAPMTADTVAAKTLPAGRYRLDVVLTADAELPVLGAQTTTTRSTALLTVDDKGTAHQVICAIDTAGLGFRIGARSPLPTAPAQIWVEGDVVRWDPGVLDLGWDRTRGPFPKDDKAPAAIDSDRDGKKGHGMLLDLFVLGSYQLQIASTGHSVFVGRRTPSGAAGVVRVLRAEQRVLSGAPFAATGMAVIDNGSFVLARVGDRSSCDELSL